MTFQYKVPQDTTDFEPRIYYFNETNQSFEELENQIVEDGKITAKVTHFSKYILLNRVEFEKIWKDEIVKPGEYSQMDLALVIDSSGSMVDNDPYDLRLEVAKGFVDELGEKDRACVVNFDSIASLYCSFTYLKEMAKASIDNIYPGGWTALYHGIEIANKQFAMESKEDTYKVMILLTDGQNNRGDYQKEDVLKEAIENGIIIYTIGLGDDSDAETLEYIAEKTGGKYFYADAAEDLGKIFDNISDKTIDYLTDTDKDGICDYYEDNLTKLVNGLDIKLDKNNPDVDGDGLLDGEEVYVYIDKDSRVYYKMVSNPNVVDTDGDGIADGEDKNPLSYTVTDRTLALLAGLSYNNLTKYIGKTIFEIAKEKGTLKNFDSEAVQLLGNAVLIGSVDSGSEVSPNIQNSGLGCVAVCIPQVGKKHRMVVVYRGTETNNFSAPFDAGADFELFLGLDTRQSMMAYNFYKNVACMDKFDYYLSGHSLGGRLVQNVLYKVHKYNPKNVIKPKHSATFNGLGYNKIAYALLKNDVISQYDSSLKNYYYTLDAVGHGLAHSLTCTCAGIHICLEGKNESGELFEKRKKFNMIYHGIVYLQNDYDMRYVYNSEVD